MELKERSFKLSRRDFIGLGGGLITTGLGSRMPSSSDVVTETVPLIVPDLHRDLIGMRIAFLTDLHFSAFFPEEILDQALADLKASRAELLLLGGDYLWTPQEDQVKRLFPIRSPKLKEFRWASSADALLGILAEKISPFIPKLGALAVFGNHDRWYLRPSAFSAFAKVGITTLSNELAVIKRGAGELQIYGFDDFWTGVPSVKALENLERRQGTPLLLLSHNPDLLPWMETKCPQIWDLALCGHTHGGQICLPNGAAFTYNIDNTSLGKGLTPTPRGFIYTSRGVGVVELPFRWNCPSELTVIQLSDG